MASSLQRQLANLKANASTASTLSKKKRQKAHAVSLIFDPKTASTYDFDSIFQISLEGLKSLEAIDSRFITFEKSLFSETSIAIDRFVQTSEENGAIDKAVESFLSLLAPRVLLQPAIQALEWLVRRFRINELNSELLLVTFLPYYSHPVFVRILDVVATPLPPLFAFLANSKATATVPPKSLIFRALSRDAELFSLISEHVVKQVKTHRDYRTLLSFWASSTIAVIASMKASNVSEESIAEQMLPFVSDIISESKSPEAHTAAYMVTIVLISQCALNNEILEAFAKTIAGTWTKKSFAQGLTTLTQILQFQDADVSEQFRPFDASLWKCLCDKDNVRSVLEEHSKDIRVDRFITAYILSVLEYSTSKIAECLDYLETDMLSQAQKVHIMQHILRAAINHVEDGNLQETLGQELSDRSVSEMFREIIVNAAELERIDLDTLELQLKCSLSHQLFKDASDSAETIMQIDAQSPLTFDQRLVAFNETKITSFLRYISSTEFYNLADLFLQGVYEKKDMYAMFIRNEKLFGGNLDLILTFLMRLWTEQFPVLARVSSLQVFLKTIRHKSDAIDFQGCLLYLFVALSDTSEKVRLLASDCLRYLSQRYERVSKFTEVWGLESIYGSGPETEELKWLAPKEIVLFTSVFVVPRLEETVVDKSYIKLLLSEVVDTSKSADGTTKKKEAHFKASVLAFLCSHLVGSPSYRLKLFLLQSLANTTMVAAPITSLSEPLYASWVANREDATKVMVSEKINIEVFERALVDAIQPGDKDSGVMYLISYLKANISGLTDAASKRIINIWPRLRSNTQAEIVRQLMELELNDSSDIAAFSYMSRLEIDSNIFQSLLSEIDLAGSSQVQSQQPVKRRRRSSSSQNQQSGKLMETLGRNLKRLTLTLELLERNSPETHPSLLKILFNILNDLLLLKMDSSLPVLYTQQVLVDCMLPILKGMQKSKLDPNLVRIDIVVNCIRFSTSPQIQNRFLLLIACLANLSPELVLHSVMPIFTFMGANTIRQDDEFSAHVIQQTISQVVPALASSAFFETDESGNKSSFNTVQLLLSFVNAFHHIPYHRRVKLFSTLVKTVGPDKSLHLVLRLLGKLRSDAVQRGKKNELESLDDFLIVFLNEFALDEQISAISRYISVVNELAVVLSNDDINSIDLSGLSPEKLILFKSDLLEFIRIAISNQGIRFSISDAFEKNFPNDGAVEQLRSDFAIIIEQLLGMIAKSQDRHLVTYRNTTYNLLDDVLNLMPIKDFVNILEKLIAGNENEITIKRGLVLIKQKFESTKSTDTVACNSALRILPAITTVVTAFTNKNTDVVKLGIQAIEILAGKFAMVEADAFFGDVLDLVVAHIDQASDNKSVMISALICLSTISVGLGARMISYLPRIMPIVLSVLKTSISNGDELVIIATFTLLDSLLKRIPMFMASYVKDVFVLYFLSSTSSSVAGYDDPLSVEEARNILLDQILAKIETKQLILSLINSWDDVVDTCDNIAIELYLSTLHRSIEHGSRKAVLADSSRLFNFILIVFDARNNYRDITEDIISIMETKIIEVAMQIILKLNDKAFRPHFVKVVRWTFEENITPNYRRNRQYIFYKFVERMFNTLKSIVTSYYGYIVDNTAELLEQFITIHSKLDIALWESILRSLIAAFSNDQEEFWQAPVRFDRISQPLLAQIALGMCSSDLLQRAIVAFTVSCSSEENHKIINKGILSYMKDMDYSEDNEMDMIDDYPGDDAKIDLTPLRVIKNARKNSGNSASDVKIAAIHTLKSIYERLGEEWLSMLPQLVPIVAELLEDEDENVETEVRKYLVPVIESVLGESLDRYLT
ncbi:hypothetical protein V1511DRAFT_491437 [Dipodascopsis uninucleata]